MKTLTSFREYVLKDGFAIVPGVLDSQEIDGFITTLSEDDARDSLRRRGEVFAVRNLLEVSAEVRELAGSNAILEIVAEILGEHAIPVRGILFDKTPNANWKVPWHQDVTIAVNERVDVEGYGPWSSKSGVIHVQPPAHVLENMLSVRLHLDDCDEQNGALKVVPGSHTSGRIPETDASCLGIQGPTLACEARAGDALLMRPLLLHASSPATSPRHRRVIHIDYAAVDLPNGLKWALGIPS